MIKIALYLVLCVVVGLAIGGLLVWAIIRKWKEELTDYENLLNGGEKKEE